MKKILAILLALTLALSVGVAAMAEEETELWGEGLKIGLAQMHYTNAFRIAETESVISAFEAVGAEVVWNEAGNDTATQVANAKDLLAQDIDYLLLPPKEEAGLVPRWTPPRKPACRSSCLTVPPTASPASTT